MPDDSWGERVVSCVVPAVGQVLSVEGIAAAFLEQASRETLPLEIHIVEDLPRGPAGKVILAEAKAMIDRRRPKLPPAAADGSDIQERVFSVAASAFKTDLGSLSLESDASNTAGWNSLAHVEFLLSLEVEFEVRMAPRDLMSIVSLGDAVRVIEAKMAEVRPQRGAA
jgi:long-chain acyl-CoA synthetase